MCVQILSDLAYHTEYGITRLFEQDWTTWANLLPLCSRTSEVANIAQQFASDGVQPCYSLPQQAR